MTKSKLARRETADQSGLYARLTWFRFKLDEARQAGRHITLDGVSAGLQALDEYRGHDAADRAVALLFQVSDRTAPPEIGRVSDAPARLAVHYGEPNR